MKDPFFLPPVPRLAEAVRPWADWLDLPTLPLHIHEVLLAALLYSVIFYPISPLLSKYFVSGHYLKLSRKRQLNWDAHVVSMVQSLLINSLALWVMITDDDRTAVDWEERVWGYSGGAGMVQALAAGYFLWDLVVTSINLDVFGPGTLAHAASALVAYGLGFRPFVNYYSCNFILWELSTPFLNVHWFMDKVHMTGSRAQLYNGILLLFTFFSCRLVYGTYSSFRVMHDLWTATTTLPSIGKRGSPILAFADVNATVPAWLSLAYIVSNCTLNGLNFYWFFMMTKAVRKRFEPAGGKKERSEPVTEVEIDLSGVASGAASGKSKPSSSRRRKA